MSKQAYQEKPALLILAGPAWQERAGRFLGLQQQKSGDSRQKSEEIKNFWQAQEPVWVCSVYQLTAEALVREKEAQPVLALVLVDILTPGEMEVFAILKQLGLVRAAAYSFSQQSDKLEQARAAGAAVVDPERPEEMERIWEELLHPRVDATLEIVAENILDGPLLEHNLADEKLARETITDLARDEIAALREREKTAQAAPLEKPAKAETHPSEKDRPKLSQEELDALLGP